MSNELRPMRDFGHTGMWWDWQADGRRLSMKIDTVSGTFTAEGEGFTPGELAYIQQSLMMPRTKPATWPVPTGGET